MTANPERGEVSCKLPDGNGGTVELTLRPTYEAMVQIETELGLGLMPLLRKVARQDAGVVEMACIVHHGAAAGGHDLERGVVGAMVMGGGFEAAAKAVTEFLTNAITGGRKPSKKSAAPAARKKAARKK